MKPGDIVNTPDGKAIIREEEWLYKKIIRFGVVHIIPVPKFAGWPIVYYFTKELKEI